MACIRCDLADRSLTFNASGAGERTKSTRETETEPTIDAGGAAVDWSESGEALTLQLSATCLFMAFVGRTGAFK
jgi:hypothetical protein